jgi:RNA polymerase-binding transcription factor DksA
MPTKKPAPKKAAAPVAKAAAKKAVPEKNTKPAAKLAPEKAAPVKKATAKPASKIASAPKEVKLPEPATKKKPAEEVGVAEEQVLEIKTPKNTATDNNTNTLEHKPTEQQQNSPKKNEALVRYNDADLTEFRELINKKMEAAKKELNYLQGLITRKDDMGGDESESRYMTMEDGSMSMEREQLSQMASRQITYIDHLEKALIRIENKTYGICRVTGKLIDKARLRAVPHATLSLEAKLGLVKPSGE